MGRQGTTGNDSEAPDSEKVTFLPKRSARNPAGHAEAAETLMQQQARALGDPTRHSMFRYVARSAEPVDVAELTAHFGFNHNAIRQHLAKLVAARLVRETKAEVRGPGRPRLVYTVDATAGSRWGVTGPFERLSVLLCEIIRTGDDPIEVGRRVGRAQQAAAPDAQAAVARVAEVMAGQGFEPKVRPSRVGTDVILGNCPFEAAALEDRETVCRMHLGLAEGLVENAPGVAVTELIAKDPRIAQCRLMLRIDDKQAS